MWGATGCIARLLEVVWEIAKGIPLGLRTRWLFSRGRLTLPIPTGMSQKLGVTRFNVLPSLRATIDSLGVPRDVWPDVEVLPSILHLV